MRLEQDAIHDKGFRIADRPSINPYQTMTPAEFNKIRIGLKQVDDAILNLGSIKQTSTRLADKKTILKALHEHDYTTLREVSNLFFEVSGIYQRLCKYLAFLYRYDWFVVPYVVDMKEEKVLQNFTEILSYLDDSNIKQLFGDIALKVITNGCYYGYFVDSDSGITVQELPVNYCRSRFFKGREPIIEFNMKYFDDSFKDIQYRLRILNTFPKEFKKGYLLYKEGKLVGDYQGDTSGWYMLEPGAAIKFNLNNSDYPVLADVIPAILDLDEAQDLDRKKMMQQLLKVIIQKLPIDKNGDLIFDVDEAKDLHNNAVEMLKRAIGVDVLTTFAEIDVADMADKRTATTSDDLKKVERNVYNQAAIATTLFNTDSNLSLEKSILNDEASVRNLLLQFQNFLNVCIKKLIKNKKKCNFRVFMLETTIYNYQDLSRMYKEQVQIGYSKMLPQVALGHSQSEIIAMAYFENEILHLSDIMIPPLMSSTMNSETVLNARGQGEEKSAGRPEKDDDDKSDKTIANKQSM